MSDVDEYVFRKKTAKSLGRIEALLNSVVERMENMSVELDGLILQVGETEGVEQSVITLLQGIQARLNELVASEADLVATKAKIAELSGDLHTSETAVAEAVANFPAP